MADSRGNPVEFDSVKGELGAPKESFEVSSDRILEKYVVQKELEQKEGASLASGREMGGTGFVERNFKMGSDGYCEKINTEGVLDGDDSDPKLEDFGSLIDEQLGKVSLDGTSNCLIPVVALENDRNVHGDSSVGNGGIGSMSAETVLLDGSSARMDSTKDERDVVGMKEIGTKIDGTEDESDSDEESESDEESSSSSCSSSSSSSSDEEEDEDSGELSGEKEAKNEKHIADEHIDKEGEIMISDPDEMVSWSDVEDDESGEKGPITSKNELQVLPPVPSVTVTLEPHHQTLPVGVVLSIVGAQVIVEGAEKHNPLNEGSILWITESRVPLGIVDEIFGPVKNPYYIVRYNSESEVPTGIRQGTSISFVQEFASHVLNEKSLYRKGYDASGEHDEELLDEVEFSDDEKEAEYKRNLKMKKGGRNRSKTEAERNEKGNSNIKTGRWNHNRPQTPVTKDQCMVPTVTTSLNQDNHSCLTGFRQDLAGDQAMASPCPPIAQAPIFSPPNGIWFPPQQQKSIGLPPAQAANGMLWMQQYQPYPLYQAPSQTGVRFQQQMSATPGGLPLNIDPLAGQLNFGMGPAFGPWPTIPDQNMLNPSRFGIGLHGQQASLPQGSQMSHSLQAQQAPLHQGSQMSHNLQDQQTPSPQGSQMNHNLLPYPANLGETVNLNQGRGGSGRRVGNQRGRGRFSGGRGRNQRR